MLRSIVVVLAAVALIAPAAARRGPATEDALRSALAAQMAQGPAASGAYVVDLTDGHVVFDDRSADKRLSASVTKLYTTSTALLELGLGHAAGDQRPRRRPPHRIDVHGEPVPARLRGLHVRHRGLRPQGLRIRTRASSGWRPSCAARGCGTSGAACSATRRSTPTTAARGSTSSCAAIRCSAAAARTAPPASWSGRSRTARGRRSASTAACATRRAPTRRPTPRPSPRAASPGRCLPPASPWTVRPAPRRRRRRRACWRRPAHPPWRGSPALINRPSDNYAADSMLRLIGARVADKGSRAGGAGVDLAHGLDAVRARARDPDRIGRDDRGPDVPAGARADS